MTRTLIATLNWNDLKRTKRCINSLIKTIKKNVSIIVIDNNSKNFEYKKLCSFIRGKTSSYKEIDYSYFFKKKKKIYYHIKNFIF